MKARIEPSLAPAPPAPRGRVAPTLEPPAAAAAQHPAAQHPASLPELPDLHAVPPLQRSRRITPDPDPDPLSGPGPEGRRFRPPADAFPGTAAVRGTAAGIAAERSAPPDLGPGGSPPAAVPAPAHEPTADPVDRALRTTTHFLDRHPWLLPTLSFSAGWLGFFLFQRGEDLARVVAVIALLGWPWLLADNLIGRWVVARSKGRFSAAWVYFVTQQIQQEILFFALPFLFGATVLASGQVVFLALALVIAVLISIDPVYMKRVAPHAGLSSALHAYCTFVAALVVLPVALHLPLERALPLALAVTGLSLLASLPRMLRAAPTWKLRLLGCAVLAASFPMLYALRGWIPPAGFWVHDARITDRIDALQPGRPIGGLSSSALQVSGLIAFVAVRAPTGLSQSVVFDWHHRGELIDRIPAQISGGREAGFRTYSRKQNFPAESRGPWRVDLRTPDGQLIARMRFEVD